MRGIIPAKIIEYFSHECNLEPCEMFDLIGGTSIGGIISLGIGCTKNKTEPLVNKDSIVNLLRNAGPKIFSTSKIRGLLKNLTDRCRYSKEGIENVCMETFLDLSLLDVMPGCQVIVTAVKRLMQQGE